MKASAVSLLVLLLSAPLLAQQHTSLSMSVDLAAFRFDEQRSYIELSYGFPRSALHYAKDDGSFRGSALVNTIIRDVAGKRDPIVRMWRVPITMADTTEMMQKMMIGEVTWILEPGRYRIAVIARDEARPSVSDSLEIPFEVRKFPERSMSISDIQLCASIQKIERDTTNIFYKNTLEVIPNPTLLYGASLPSLMYYTELYNAEYDEYQVKTDIISSYGKTMSSRAQRKSGKFPSRVEVGSVPVGRLSTGVYTFILSYGDTAGVVKLSQSKTFYVYNPDVPLDTVQARAVAASIALEFASMAENELDEQFSMASYVATGDEKKLWGSLRGAEAKKKFLTKYWLDRDPDLTTPRNEMYEEYMQKVRHCNEQFRTAYRPGWRTDRGRVYITYGPPDYVERFSNESDMKPYEVWRYDNIQSGVDFYFVDKGGFNDLELVHSTLRTEINNPDWQRHIQTR